MSQRRTASRTDWTTEPLPDAHARIRLDREFSPGEIALIRHGQEGEPTRRLAELTGLLRWLRALVDAAGPRVGDVRAFEAAFVRAGVACLLEQIEHLGRGKPGGWRVEWTSERSARLIHSAAPQRTVSVGMLPSCCLVIQSKYRNRARCEKLLVPFGAPFDQTMRLLQMTARDVYKVHFDKPATYFSARRRPLEDGPAAQEARPLLELIAERRFELQALLCL